MNSWTNSWLNCWNSSMNSWTNSRSNCLKNCRRRSWKGRTIREIFEEIPGKANRRRTRAGIFELMSRGISKQISWWINSRRNAKKWHFWIWRNLWRHFWRKYQLNFFLKATEGIPEGLFYAKHWKNNRRICWTTKRVLEEFSGGTP